MNWQEFYKIFSIQVRSTSYEGRIHWFDKIDTMGVLHIGPHPPLYKFKVIGEISYATDKISRDLSLKLNFEGIAYIETAPVRSLHQYHIMRSRDVGAFF